MTSKQKELFELLKKEITLLDLANYLKLSPKQTYNRVLTLINQGYNIYRKNFATGDIQFSVLNQSLDNMNNNILYTIPKDDTLRVVIFSDAHIGNSLQRLDVLDEMYNYCIKNNIHITFNCGDLLNGVLSSGCGKPLKKDYEKQINILLEKYPFDPSIINFTLLGNHDKDFFNGGMDLKQLLNKKRFDINTLDYQDSSVKVKNDEIRLIHPIDSKFKTFADNSKIIFRGHSHASGAKTVSGLNVFCAYVPTSSDMFYHKEYEYPGIYDVYFVFDNNGLIKKIVINSLIYIDKFVKVGEVSHGFSTSEKYDKIKYEEKPKKLILTK